MEERKESKWKRKKVKAKDGGKEERKEGKKEQGSFEKAGGQIE